MIYAISSIIRNKINRIVELLLIFNRDSLKNNMDWNFKIFITIRISNIQIYL